MQMQRATFVQGISRLQPFILKRYQSLKLGVENEIAQCSQSDILVCLRGTTHFSHDIFDVFTLQPLSFRDFFYVRLHT